MTWDGILTARQSRYPNEHFIRFVARNYFDVSDRSAVEFLDIGSGRHAANTRFLEDSGFNVLAVDASHHSLAHWHGRVEDFDCPNKTFDCIADINTLCHIENPPIERIRGWLKPGGKFFSIAPAFTTSRGHLEGKGFVRCATQPEIFALYRIFENKQISSAHYHDVHSWLIEATK